MTTTYTLKVDDTSLFKVGDAYRTFVGTTLDAGTFVVGFINDAQKRIMVETSDGWVPLPGRSISYNTDTLLPGNSFQLEAVTLRIGVKTGMDKVPTNRRIVYGVTPNPCPECVVFPGGPLPIYKRKYFITKLQSQQLGMAGKNGRDLMVQVKNSLVASGIWTVTQSCDGNIISATDLWTDYTKLVGAGSGGSGFSWLILKNVKSGVQLLFNVTVTTLGNYPTSSWNEITCYISPSVGFTGGNTTGTPPNATDRFSCTVVGNWLGSVTAASPDDLPIFQAFTWVADDGSNTRIAWFYKGLLVSWWQFDTIDSACSGSWTPFMGHCLNRGDYFAPARLTINAFQASGNRACFSNLGNVETGLEAWSENHGSTPYVDAFPRNQATTQCLWMSPMGLGVSGEVAPRNGPLGYYTDMYWLGSVGGVPIFSDGDTMGGGASIHIGQMLLPWDKTIPAPTGGANVDYPASGFFGRSVG